MKMTVGAAAAFALLAASSAAQAAGPAVALVLGVKGSPFYQALACGAKAKAKELGLALTISAPDQFAADLQIPVVNAVAATTPAVAVIVPSAAQECWSCFRAMIAACSTSVAFLIKWVPSGRGARTLSKHVQI